MLKEKVRVMAVASMVYAKATLNSSGESHALALISEGKVDRESSWSMSAEDENRILGDPPDWVEYGRWHLGKNTDESKDTKAYWKYPFGKDGKVFRRGVIAAKSRATAQGDTEVANGADKLLKKIDGDKAKDEGIGCGSDGRGSVKRFFEVKAQKDNKSAEIYLYDSIGVGWFGGIGADRFVKELKALGKVKTISLYINSDGGDVFEGFTIYQQLVRHSADIHVYIDGLAASIASVVAMAGSKICVADTGMMMIHDPWGMIVGNARDMRKRADTLDQIRGSIVRVYANQTKLDEMKVSQLMAEETWMTASQALEMGFATEIAEPKLMAASAVCPFDLKKFNNAPSWWGRAPVEQPRLVALRAKRGQMFVLE